MVHKNIFQITALAAALALAGCGGESGYFGNVESDIESIKVLSISEIELEDASGDTLQTLNLMGATAKVTVKDSAGKVVTGALVNFSSTGGVEFGSTNGSVLTNANGEAIISVKPIDSTDTGTYQLSATVEHNGITVETKPYNFSLQASKITLVDVKVGETTLNSGASTNITLKTQDANTNANQNNVTVNFTASCGTFEPATVVSSNQGDVTTSYKAIAADGKLCAGKQTITVLGSNIAEAKTIEVDIAAIEANSLVYTSDAVNLGIEGSGSAFSGQVEFTLYANGTPAANQDVKVELLKAPEDLSFVTFNNRDSQIVKSDSQGKVIVNLYPGNKPGPVEIKAALVSNKNVFALSKDVAVATGRATQDGFSLSVSKNSLQNRVDGDSATINVMLRDRTGNPVPNGTVVSFVSEGGVVTPNCSTSDGRCSVTLSVQDPRPLDNRVSVLAYVEGDKTYIDVDGDNLYTAGTDTLTNNIGDFFRDDNENLNYDAANGEFVYRRPDAGKEACAASTINQPNIAGTCNTGLNATLRKQLVFAFANNVPTFTNVRAGKNLLSFNMYGNSEQSVPMPSDSTINVTVEDNTPDNNLSCSAELQTGSSPVASVFNLATPSTFKSNGQAYYAYRLKDCAGGDSFKISVSAPDGKVSTIYAEYK